MSLCEDCGVAPATIREETLCATCASVRAATYDWAICSICGQRVALYGDEPADGLPEARDPHDDHRYLLCDRDECADEDAALAAESREYDETVAYHWSHR